MIGWLGAAFALGFVAGPALGGLLAHPELGQAGYRLPLFIAGGLSFAASLGALLFVRETCVQAKVGSAPGVAFKTLQHALRHPVLGRALVITLFYTAAFAAAESTFGLWAQHRYGWGPSKLSICFASVAITAALAQGFLTGRITRRWGEALTLAGGLAIIAATLALQPLGQGMPRVHRQHHAEVTYRHAVAVYIVRRYSVSLHWRQMRHDLVAMKIEVHPVVAGASFRAAEQIAVERAGVGQGCHREGEVEGR